MADGKIEIETGIDQSGIKDGLKKVNSLLSDAEKYYKSLGKEGAASFAKITAQMKKVDAETAITGNITSGLAKKQKILKTEIEKLISSGLKPENLKVKSLQKAYDELNTVQTKTVKQKTSIKQTFASMRDVMQGPVAAAGLLKGGLDKVKATIDELTEAYKTQIKAETQLETTAKNNPYLDDASVQSLKDYASEIQSYSTYGDEELLPMMAKLAAAGRTQDEIFAIMTTATDMAASGAFSLDSAVSNLNKSYGGLSGELGESIPEIKDLTAEQLKNGAAVELLAGRYKGIAVEVASATGASEQLANTIGDFKESLGSLTLPAANQWDMFFKGFVEKGISAVDSFNEYWDKKRRKNIGKQVTSLSSGTYSSGKTGVDFFTDEELSNAVEYLDSLKQMNSIQEDTYITIKSELGHRERITKDTEKEAAAEAEAAEAVAAENKKNQDATDIINANTAAREQALATLQATADATGETVDIQDKLNAYVQSYVSLVTTNPDLVSDTNSASLALLETTKAIAEEAKKETTETERIEQAMEALGLMTGDTFDAMKQGILDDINNTNLDVDAKQALIDKINGITEATTDWGGAASTVYAQISSLASGYAQLKADEATNAADAYNSFIEQNDDEITALEDKEETASGLTTAEQERLAELNATQKELAQEEYDREVAAFETAQALSIAQTLISGAEAAVKAYNALAEIPVVGPALGIAAVAGISALTAAQVAVIQNQTAPTAPTFTTGGVIGGTSYTGDKLYAPVNSKERVLTPQQNAAFEKLAYDGTASVGGLSTSDISAIAEAVAGMYNQSVNTNVYLDKRVMAKAITTVQKNGDF